MRASPYADCAAKDEIVMKYSAIAILVAGVLVIIVWANANPERR